MSELTTNDATTHRLDAAAAHDRLVAALSDRWPYDLDSASPAALTLTPAELGQYLATVRSIDQAATLEDLDWQALIVRASNLETSQACMTVGALVLNTLSAYASAQLRPDVEAHREHVRELQAVSRRREAAESVYGVASLFAPRRGAA